MSSNRNVVILLDIDETLIPTSKLKDGEMLWNGGDATIWQQHLSALQEAGLKVNITLWVGIATYKHEYIDTLYKDNGLRGDSLSATILNDEAYRKLFPEMKTLLKQGHLGDYIHPNLVFFTNNQSKVTYALNPAAEKLSISDKKDVWLIDDKESTCEEAKNAGYQASSAANLSDSTTPIAEISAIFKPIFAELNLLAAFPDMKDKKLEPADSISEPEANNLSSSPYSLYSSSSSSSSAVVASQTLTDEDKRKLSLD